MLAKLLAGILGLMAFFVCIAVGLVTGARAEVAIVRGLQAMLIFCLLGWVIGWVADSAIHEQVRKEALEAMAKLKSGEQEAAASGNGQSASSETKP
jgi:uncharacterized membrane protein